MPRKRKRFCDLHPICFEISKQKEVLKRNVSDLLSRETFAKEKSPEKLPVAIHGFQANMIKRAPGVDLTSQLNKAENLRIASAAISGILIHPGETFSFWRLVGRATKRKGYKEGRVIVHNKLVMGRGGGLCNLGNHISRIILHSPLTITEFHKHSDALAPTEGERIPLAAGTAVSYNYVDFRFQNNTDQTFQLLLWCDGEDLCGQLRAQHDIPYAYELVEEDRHFRKEGNKYYHLSKLYQLTTCKDSGEQIAKELIWDNHSEVMFDYTLIPEELIV